MCLIRGTSNSARVKVSSQEMVAISFVITTWMSPDKTECRELWKVKESWGHFQQGDSERLQSTDRCGLWYL